MPSRNQRLASDAKAILDRIKGRGMQVFDVQTQAVHSEAEIAALRAALRSFIDNNDRDFKVEKVVEAGNLNIEAEDSCTSVLQEAANALESNESSEIVGGGILFKGTNGRWYTVVVEAIVAPADPRFVKENVPAPVKIDSHEFSTDQILQLRKALRDNVFEDGVGLCEYVSRQFQIELNLKQAGKLMKTLSQAVLPVVK